ncbi:AraC family transcriptional regulator [Dyadobacter sp. CY347]|uniref:helix-turn-helix domain-containing protein n=1 Tax=Dyadobacter sp. CY347 TaxID=2909336 RepID=UPI001F3188C2|nr:helix-turn-helix domain-containing protein [Dyadobacter sp. CY347]MCF2487779.1 helix-turn-helix domain-containing protein [Dyadobacter sp. CY347]
MARIPDEYVSRKAEILAQFKQVLEKHLDDLMAGRIDKMLEIKEIADILCLHPVHLSKVIKLETGHHACYFYEQRILLEAKKLLTDITLPIGAIAHKLDYDVSNFTKFFKKFSGMTPSLYRKSLLNDFNQAS